MKRFGDWATALLLGAALGCAGDGGPRTTGADGGDGGSDGSADVAQAPVCLWDSRAPELKLPDDRVKGALRGSSRNASTTCTRQKGTGGPEAIYLLRLVERTLIDIEVVSSEVDTVLAIRRVCDDPLTELACDDGTANASAPTPERDAGVITTSVDAGSPAAEGQDAHLRASLAAGVYFLIVDEGKPSGLGGEFELKVHASPPPAQTSCAEAQLLSAGSPLVDEELDLAGDPSPCAETVGLPALFYRAVIPSGQRLIARAVPTAGDRSWTPTLQVFSSCGASGAGSNLCLGSDRADPQGQRVLRYVNDSPGDQSVLLAVSSTAVVERARFRLEMNLAEWLSNLTCPTARPLSDGQLLRNQDLAEGSVDGSRCSSPGMPSLFYRATLYPNQSVQVAVEGISRANVTLISRDGCSDSGTACRYSGPWLSVLNTEATVKTVVIEATTYSTAGVEPFDLRVTMPIPPGAISVRTGARELITREAGGGQATFDVYLTSPVIEPVDVPIASSDPAEGTASPATLRFTAENWQTPQTVAVTGVDDSARDGNRSYRVTVGPSISQEERYQGVGAPPVALLNLDDEPGFSFEGPLTLITSESGAQSTFKVVLNRAPAATVRLPLDSSDSGEGKVSTTELVFEPSTWNLPQTVTVTGIDDDERDGNQSYQVLTGAAISDDAAYAGLDPADLGARNADNDHERVAPHVISGDLSCSGVGSPGLAVDPAGRLYAVMICQAPRMGSADAGVPAGDAGPMVPTAFVAVSADGGRTFGAPVRIDFPAYYFAVVAGNPGVALVAASGPGGFSVFRTEDGGATWQPRLLRSPSVYIPNIAAAGDRMLVTADTDTGLTWWLSEDAGRTFHSFRPPFPGLGSLRMDGDGTIWAAVWDDGSSRQTLRTSRDAGRTFDAGTGLPVNAQGITIGPKLVFSYLGREVTYLPRDGSAAIESVPGLPESFLLGPLLVADERDNLVIVSGIYDLHSPRVELRRLAAGAGSFTAPRSLPGSDVGASAVPLSDTATAILLGRRGQISIAVETWESQ